MKDKGIIIAFLLRLRTQRLPRVLRIKTDLEAGDRLSASDSLYLLQVVKSAHQIKPLIDRQPEYQDLFAQLSTLLCEISRRALANEPP